MTAQSSDLCVEFNKAPLEHLRGFAVGVLCICAQNRADVIDGEACVAIGADLKQTLRICLVVVPIVAATARWRWTRGRNLLLVVS